jgi:hypothetical protein
VDPVGEPERYLDAAQALGLRLRYVIDTHVHADHLSPGRELAAAAGAAYVLHASARTGFALSTVEDGDVLPLGNLSARVLHVPGHTPEHLALVVTDRTRGDEPWFIFTGHTLMAGDMGRTELATSAEAGARDLYRSAERLRALPDYLEILPGAFAGAAGLGGRCDAPQASGLGGRHLPAVAGQRVRGGCAHRRTLADHLGMSWSILGIALRMLQVVAQHRGEIGICGSCMDARGLQDADLVQGSRRSSLEELADWTLWAARVLVF